MKICILTSGLNIYARIYASKLIKFNHKINSRKNYTKRNKTRINQNDG